MTNKMLYGVTIQGPDDVIAAPSYDMAVAIADAFNDWWKRHIKAKKLHEYDPLLWAIPGAWPHGADSHAESLEKPSSDYAGFIDFAAENAAIPPAS